MVSEMDRSADDALTFALCQGEQRPETTGCDSRRDPMLMQEGFLLRRQAE